MHNTISIYNIYIHKVVCWNSVNAVFCFKTYIEVYFIQKVTFYHLLITTPWKFLMIVDYIL